MEASAMQVSAMQELAQCKVAQGHRISTKQRKLPDQRYAICKLVQVHTGQHPNTAQVEDKFKTCVDLQLHFILVTKIFVLHNYSNLGVSITASELKKVTFNITKTF